MQNVRKTINMDNSELNGNSLDSTKNETAMNSGVAMRSYTVVLDRIHR